MIVRDSRRSIARRKPLRTKAGGASSTWSFSESWSTKPPPSFSSTTLGWPRRRRESTDSGGTSPRWPANCPRSGAPASRLMKKAHLRRWLRRSSLHRTTKYASLLPSSPPGIWIFLISLHMVFFSIPLGHDVVISPNEALAVVAANQTIAGAALVHRHLC